MPFHCSYIVTFHVIENHTAIAVQYNCRRYHNNNIVVIIVFADCYVKPCFKGNSGRMTIMIFIEDNTLRMSMLISTEKIFDAWKCNPNLSSI